MKTLDEVLEAIKTKSGLKLSSRRKDDRWEVPIDLYQEIIHYLKEYKILQYGYIKAMADLEDNPPLTWEQLKSMEGKPVWVEADSGIARWCIIDGFFDLENDIFIRFMSRFGYIERSENLQGIVWQAYRKERKVTGGSLVPEPKSKRIGDDTDIKWKEKK